MRALPVVLLCSAPLFAAAQDRFPDQLPNVAKTAPSGSRATPAATTAPAAVRANDNARGDAVTGESKDFGIQPVAQLRPSDQLHGPTPTSIPGGKVVGARQLAQWMQGQQTAQGRVLLLHAIGSQTHLPNATPAGPASQGGSFDDQVQRDFGAWLQGASGGDRTKLIVTYCQGVQCWGSYNAALRAIRLGYTNVHWFRGGIEGWQQAGLPLINAAR